MKHVIGIGYISTKSINKATHGTLTPWCNYWSWSQFADDSLTNYQFMLWHIFLLGKRFRISGLSNNNENIHDLIHSRDGIFKISTACYSRVYHPIRIDISTVQTPSLVLVIVLATDCLLNDAGRYCYVICLILNHCLTAPQLMAFWCR